jgi:hypothetical protein
MSTKELTPEELQKRIDERWLAFTRKIPYGVVKTGFMVNPEDGCQLLPDPEQINWIEQGFDFMDAGSSLREVSDWLSQKLLGTKCQRSKVNHQTLGNLYNTYRKPFRKGRSYRRTRAPTSAATRKLISAKLQARYAAQKAIELEKKQALKKKQLQPEQWDSPREPEPEDRSYPADRSDPNAPRMKILFEPTDRQKLFLQADELEVLYGGAAGGGKSYAMIADPMRYFHNGNFNGLLLRRTNDALRELIRETKKLYPKIFPGAEFKEQASKWVFPSGAEFWMSYLDRDEDVERYIGQAFTWIGIDELTQYPTPYAWDMLKSRLRSTDPDLQKRLSMRATTNPGGPGHQWVKKMFIDPAIPGEPFWARDLDTGEILKYPDDPKYKDRAGQPLNQRLFIPAKLSDNPHLFDDGSYERSLLSLPEDMRRKLLEGDWSVMEGAAFPEFNPKHHVVSKDTEIPPSWRRFRSCDYGYSSHSSVLWFAIEPGTGILHVYRELYTSRVTGVELADKIMTLEQGDRVDYGVLDSSVWHKRGHNGPSIAEEMIARGCKWRPSDRGDGSRIAGKNRLHELLKIDPYLDRPGIVFLENCRQIIADLPMLPTDPDGGEDIDDKYASDHSYDALRYGIMSRPRTTTWGDWDRGKEYKQEKFVPVDPVFGW